MSLPNYITPAGHARLCEEMERLLRIERPRVVETVTWAASNGDRSENGDYIYGKRRLREIDRRLRYLTKQLDQAQIVDFTRHAGNDQIFFGATVRFCFSDGTEQTVTIVGIDEIDPALGQISWRSPLARALIKAREGDQVRYQSPAGEQIVDILAVHYSA